MPLSVSLRGAKMIHFILYGISIIFISLLINYFSIKENKNLKKLNDELKLQRTYFTELFENSEDAIIILDNKSRIVSVNKSFEKLFQYKDNEVKGLFVDDIIASCETKDAFEISEIVMQGGTVTAETKRKRKDGGLVDVSVLAFPVILDINQIGIYAVYKDISDRKKSEQALELQKTYFRKLLKALQKQYV